MRRVLAILIAIALGASIVGCGEEEISPSDVETPMTPIEITITVKGDVTSKTTPDDWVYFSFKTGSMIDPSRKNTKEWDIRVLGTKFSTNSGTTAEETGSGGLGGAIIVNESDLTKIAQAPETGYTVDVIAKIATMAKTKPSASINPLLTKEDKNDPNYDGNHWYTRVDRKLTPDTSKCYVIRCGDGKSYARLQFIGYNKSGDTRTYTLLYNYTDRPDRKFVE
ncbi:TPA: hypothetical protein ENG04_07810 [Candidatus Poribacteria bacterium]|nr:hypothetical protein [Candidatus Poribacteria bacterium]HEX29970.1 hypothetical protein [Candidatus Poribacteria bacterium]